MNKYVIYFTHYAAYLCLLFVVTRSANATDLMYDNRWCGELLSPTRIACDHVSHYIYVTSPRTGKIAVFDSTGNEVNVITSVAHPSAIAVDDSGHLFVSDGQAVRKLESDGTQLLLVGGAEAYFLNPHDVAVGANGRIYVSDINDTVKIFDAAGVFRSAFGRYGWLPGMLDVPVALAVNNAADVIYVADQNNYRVNAYNSNGEFQISWGSIGNGNYASSQYLREWGMDVDDQDRVWILDELLNTVQVYAANGTFIKMFRLGEPELRTALDIAIDGNRLYITAQSTHCILAYTISDETGSTGPLDYGLIIKVVPSGLFLQWNAIPNAEGYQIIRSADPLFISGAEDTLGTTTALTYVDTEALSHWNLRFYQVQAIYSNDSSGMFSDSLHAVYSSHDQPHTVTFGVNCSSCHFSNLVYPNPLPDWWFADQVCKGCHVETGKAQPQQNHFSATDTMYCTTCHDPHFQQLQYRHKLINDVITTPHNGDRAVLFNNASDFIHGAPGYDGICEVCHTATAYYRNNSSGNHSHNAGTNCTMCHLHMKGFAPQGGSCNSCHEAPPQTAAHLAHVGIAGAGVGYGDLRKTSEFTDSATVYNFGCGNCHPADVSRHMNGILDVELYDASVPSSSLKGMNPDSAIYVPGSLPLTDSRGFTYSEGTCRNIYCHSSGQPAEVRTYAAAEWGRQQPYSCGGCHGEPPTYSSQSVGGVGANSHYQFELFWGYADIGHVMGIHWGHDSTTVADSTNTVINCTTCHYATTGSNRNTGQVSGDADCGACHTANTLPPLENRGIISNTSVHVSGQADIEFTPVPFRSPYQVSFVPSNWTRNGNYDETVLTSSSAYDPQTKTCSNVPCHMDQTTVQWGYWGTGGNAGCECHAMRSNKTRMPHGGHDSNDCTACHGKQPGR